MTLPSDAADLPLRQRKLARTKLDLLDEAVRLLDSRPLEEVRVRDLCAAADVSEATFFNYFPKKTDLLVYFIQLWSLEMAWHADRIAEDLGGLATIEEVFARTARQVSQHPNVIAEIIAFQARMREPPELDMVSEAERALRFPDLQGIETVEARTIEDVLAPLVDQAVEAGEVPAGTDRRTLVNAVAAVFFGVPSVFRCRQGDGVGRAYRAHLALLWKGLGVTR